MSGHSKWATIKHKRLHTDAKRGKRARALDQRNPDRRAQRGIRTATPGYAPLSSPPERFDAVGQPIEKRHTLRVTGANWKAARLDEVMPRNRMAGGGGRR